MKLKALKLELKDTDAERVRRHHDEQIAEIQKAPAMGLTVIEGVSLAVAVETPIAHKLGRAPVWFGLSAPRNATATGRIVETRSGSYDRTKVIVLTATGFGATILVDVAVM